MNFRLLLIVVALLLAPGLRAQTEFGETFKSRIFLGGDFSISFGTYSLIDLSPLVGYNVNRFVSAGVGGTYKFMAVPGNRQNYYGGRAFARLRPLPEYLPGVFLHGEWETVNHDYWMAPDQYSSPVLTRKWTPAILGGIGLRSQMGTNSYFTLCILFNFLDDGTVGSSIYSGPILPRVGFIYGLY